jgi:hypothetical protein
MLPFYVLSVFVSSKAISIIRNHQFYMTFWQMPVECEVNVLGSLSRPSSYRHSLQKKGLYIVCMRSLY